MNASIQQSESDLVASVRQRVANYLGDQQAGHGMDHIDRVHLTACQIQAETGGNRLVVELAALLHDVGDAKFHDGIERSAEISRQILTDLKLPLEDIEHICEIVDNISFRKGIDPARLSLEGKIVQDADRIDALGAIGIVRTIEYGATKNQPFYRADSNSNQATGIDHFHEKLFKLTNLLNTDAAKRLAGQREQFMRDFLDQFHHEVGGN